MAFKTVLTALVLTALPVVTYAMCSENHQAQSCMTGMVWDSDSQSCIKQVNS